MLVSCSAPERRSSPPGAKYSAWPAGKDGSDAVGVSKIIMELSAPVAVPSLDNVAADKILNGDLGVLWCPCVRVRVCVRLWVSVGVRGCVSV